MIIKELILKVVYYNFIQKIMKKIGLGILISIVILSLSGVAGAGKLIPANEKAEGRARITPPGLEKVVFVHYKKGFVKPETECGNSICEPGENINKCPQDCGGDVEDPDTSSCYAFLGRGVEWKDFPVNYVIDPDNSDGLTEEFVTNAMFLGAEEWDSHTDADLFGTYSIDYSLSWDSDAPDGENELVFGDYPQDGVIAVAIVWGYYTGPPQLRKIVEFDVLFDTDYVWGDASTNSEVMDLQNIATHEIGHGAGLADLYDTVCAEETMYGYSGNGDIEKRDLNAGDIVGIQKLYGGF